VEEEAFQLGRAGRVEVVEWRQWGSQWVGVAVGVEGVKEQQ
jgi:hypothetical protein